MSTQTKHTIFQFGSVDRVYFRESGTSGDWQSWNILFQTPFPSDDVRVFVIANNKNVGPGHNPAVVGIAYNVDKNGFMLGARNSDSTSGHAGFNWLAVLETPKPIDKPLDLRVGVVQPRTFQAEHTTGDWQNWDVKFSRPFATGPFVLLTESNLNTPDLVGRMGVFTSPAVVGLARDPQPDRFHLAARNSDVDRGSCAFYWVALSEKRERVGEIAGWVDTGAVDKKTFAPEGTARDWQDWEIYFNTPFLTPPIVLVTPYRKVGMTGDDVAPVGIARNVTTHGFTLSARNSASGSPGEAGYYWVAFGCNLFCTELK
jgi:hypothetical protein